MLLILPIYLLLRKKKTVIGPLKFLQFKFLQFDNIHIIVYYTYGSLQLTQKTESQIMIISTDLIEGGPFVIRAGASMSNLAQESKNTIQWPMNDERFPLNYTEDTWVQFVLVQLNTGISLVRAAEEVVNNGYTPTQLEHLTVLSRDRPALQHSNPIFATGSIVRNEYREETFPTIDDWAGRSRLALIPTTIQIQQAFRILCIPHS